MAPRRCSPLVWVRLWFCAILINLLSSQYGLKNITNDYLPSTFSDMQSPMDWGESSSWGEKEEMLPRNNKPLNILILFPDDMRHDSMSSAGTQIVQTPFLDHLSTLGKRFTHNCVTTSICWISRATLFTGQYLSRHGSNKLFRHQFCDEGKWNVTWPYLLQKAGYYVGHIGKWQFHNTGFVKKAFNWSRVFQVQHWHNINGTLIHTTDYTEQTTIEFLRERPKDTPFALTVAFYPPKEIEGKKGGRIFNAKPESEELYVNMTVPEPFDSNVSWARLNRTVFGDYNLGREQWYRSLRTPEMYQKNMKDMYRMITEVDAACKNIFNELKKQNILNETMIIFTSDNGLLHGEHGLGGKWFPFEESIRVPLVIWDPRMPASKRGETDDSFTLNIDLAPTILSAAQVDVPPGVMQGRDFSDLYLKKDAHQTWRKEFFYEHPEQRGRAIPMSSALVRKDFKYIRYDGYGAESLYHLEKDPIELNDVLNDPVHRTKLAELRRRYQELKDVVKMPIADNSTIV
eukprot:scaffold1082_cov60-Attheya_sp.AAC.1